MAELLICGLKYNHILGCSDVMHMSLISVV